MDKLESSQANPGSWDNTKKVHRVIEFNQEAWLNPYINVNTKFRKKTNMILTTDRQSNRLDSETNYHTTKWFT